MVGLCFYGRRERAGKTVQLRIIVSRMLGLVPVPELVEVQPNLRTIVFLTLIEPYWRIRTKVLIRNLFDYGNRADII